MLGGGHNGLVCAAYLARAGVDVMVVERNSRCGGALFSTTSNGFTLEHGAVDHSTIVASTIPDELDLERHGLQYAHRTASAVHLYGDGVQIAIGETAEDTARSIAAVDAADAEAWMELAALSSRMLAITAELSRDRAVPMELALRVGRVALGGAGRPLIDLATISAVDLAERWFHSPHMRALAVFRSQFSGLPPWYPGTGAVFCLTPGGHGRRFARPRGGSKAFVDALQSARGRIRRSGPLRLPRERCAARGGRMAGRVLRIRSRLRVQGRRVGHRSPGGDPRPDRARGGAGPSAPTVRADGGAERELEPVQHGRRVAPAPSARPPPVRVRGQPAVDAAGTRRRPGGARRRARRLRGRSARCAR